VICQTQIWEWQRGRNLISLSLRECAPPTKEAHQPTFYWIDLVDGLYVGNRRARVRRDDPTPKDDRLLPPCRQQCWNTL
jgi:hypothetical protein